jgi:hypothetical protein
MKNFANSGRQKYGNQRNQSVTGAGDAVVQGGDVVGNFHDIIERRARRLLQLEDKEVGERGLRALDLG